MKRARYHPSARGELRGAAAYGEAERPGRGVHLEEAVRRVVRRIQLLPQGALVEKTQQRVEDCRGAEKHFVKKRDLGFGKHAGGLRLDDTVA